MSSITIVFVIANGEPSPGLTLVSTSLSPTSLVVRSVAGEAIVAVNAQTDATSAIFIATWSPIGKSRHARGSNAFWSGVNGGPEWQESFDVAMAASGARCAVGK